MTRGASAALWPTIDFSGYLQRERFAEFGIVPPPFNGKTFTIAEVGLNFNYEIDFWGKNRSQVAAAASEEMALRFEGAETRLLLSASVANTYIQLLNIIQQRALAKENWLYSKTLARIVQDRALQGIESDIPVKTALTNEQTVHLSLFQFEEAEKQTRNQLAILLGRNPFTTEIVTMPFKYHALHFTFPEVTAVILGQRPDISAARWRVEAAANAIHVAKAGFFPNINLMALFSYQSTELGNLFKAFNQNKMIGGAFNLPLFDAGLLRANLGVKYAEYDEAVNHYNQIILNSLQDIADQEVRLRSLSKQVAAERIAVNATAHNYQLYRARYQHGIIDDVQLLEIKQLFIQQKATLVNLQAHYQQTTIALLKALGGCTPLQKGYA